MTSLHLPGRQVDANASASEGSQLQAAEVPAWLAMHEQVSAALGGLGAKLVLHW